MKCINPGFKECPATLNSGLARTCFHGEATLSYCPYNLTLEQTTKATPFAEKVAKWSTVEWRIAEKKKLPEKFCIDLSDSEDSYNVRKKFQDMGICWHGGDNALDYNNFTAGNPIIYFNSYGDKALTMSHEIDEFTQVMSVKEFLETDWEV